ncbi:sensor histidine kinase [Dactylosporangium sp. NPDC005572]|uniref:sensor histidine kinase n=1 Tax=Dactylosporangium sp. NPDC005572 TaxID=3156889 RepID=UPI0033A90069
MSPEATIGSAGRALRAGRAVVLAAIGLLLAGFAAGLIGWGYRADAALPAWVAPEGWSAGQLRDVLVGWGLPQRWYVGYFLLLELMLTAVSVVAAWFVLRGGLSWFRLYLAFVLVLFAVAGGGVPYVVGRLVPALADPAALLQGLAWIGLFQLAYVFPDGRFAPRWGRWFAAGWAAYLVASVAVPPLAGSPAEAVILPVLFGSCAVAQIYRYARISGPQERRQTRLVMLAVALRFALTLAYAATPLLRIQNETSSRGLGVYAFVMLVSYVMAALLPAAVAVAIVRHRLFDVDGVISRTLLFVILTGFVVSVYAVVVAGVGALWPVDRTIAGPLLAAGIVAVVFNPVRERVQRAVSRVVYGERGDPYGVLSRLGRRMTEVVEPDQVAPAIVDAVARALNASYVAMYLDGEPAASTGTATADVESVPLSYQGRQLGRLEIAGPLDALDRRLIADLADHSGAALSAAQESARTRRLAADLQRTREKLVAAREEERRRIRRDLHDSLGPALGSQALTIDAARSMIGSDPAGADVILGELKTQSQQALQEVRRLARELRPPVLDELGLAAALEHAAEQYRTFHLDVAIDSLPALPAAVEVAAFRIAHEALTNVARHAGATSVRLSVAVEDAALCLRVGDDGVGLPAGTRPGVGTLSMRERAEELGGTLDIGPATGGGTAVTARLPLRQD